MAKAKVQLLRVGCSPIKYIIYRVMRKLPIGTISYRTDLIVYVAVDDLFRSAGYAGESVTHDELFKALNIKPKLDSTMAVYVIKQKDAVKALKACGYPDDVITAVKNIKEGLSPAAVLGAMGRYLLT